MSRSTRFSLTRVGAWGLVVVALGSAVWVRGLVARIEGAAEAKVWPTISRGPSPAREGAGTPALASGFGRMWMIWSEQDEEEAKSILISEWDDGWGPARVVAEGEALFLSFADAPDLAVLGGGRLAAHWPTFDEGGGILASVTRSLDGGQSWSDPVIPHEDRSRVEHGFPSLVATPGGALDVLWLDGRQTLGGGPTELRHVQLFGSGSSEAVVDDQVCDCCRTSAVRLGDLLMVAYRDRSFEEVRDIRVAVRRGDRWSEATMDHVDGWVMAGCPVSGPVLRSHLGRVALAWYTGAEGREAAQVAFSMAGDPTTIMAPVRVDDGHPLGRVDVAWIDRERVLATWVEEVGEEAEIRSRVVTISGELGPTRRIARTEWARSVGSPRTAVRQGVVWWVWKVPGPPSAVQVAHSRLAGW